MSDPQDHVEQLNRRLARERKARLQAEEVAEQATSELYSANRELETLNESLREFVAIASHDLRAPITSVLGFSATLIKNWDTVSDEDKLQLIGTIENAGGRLARMVEDLLTVSRIEAGALQTHKEVTALGDAVKEVMQGFSDQLSDVSVSLEAKEVLVDPDHLRRILVNYLSNAFNHGAPPYEVRSSRDNRWVTVWIEDHGTGVPEDFIGRLFGKFARASTGQARQLGTGLGLSIVKGLARANGGEAWYEPNEPSGSRFGVRLPMVAA